VRRDLNYQGGTDYNRQYIHLDVPEEVAGCKEYSLRFKTSVYPGGSSLDHTFALYVNGAAEAEKTATLASGGWRTFQCDIPGTKLVAGRNVFLLANTSGTGGYVTYAGIDYYRFEPDYKPNVPTMIWLR
jgi:hypothetical protein